MPGGPAKLALHAVSVQRPQRAERADRVDYSEVTCPRVLKGAHSRRRSRPDTTYFPLAVTTAGKVNGQLFSHATPRLSTLPSLHLSLSRPATNKSVISRSSNSPFLPPVAPFRGTFSA